MTQRESAHYWQSPELPGVDLLRARYIRKVFARHTHESYVIAAITEGVEAFHHGGSVHRRGSRRPGSDQPRHPAHRARRDARGLGLRGAVPGRLALVAADRRRDHHYPGHPGFPSPPS